MRARIAAAILPFLFGASTVSAQTITGVLVDRNGGAPIEGAFIVLLDEEDVQRGGVLTDARGRFVVTAPRPGRYLLRADRIGYRSELSPPIDLGAGEVIEYRMQVGVEAIRLTGITVSRDRRCVVRPQQGLRTAQVWGEARKALAAAAWTEDRRLVRYELRQYQRRLEAGTLRVIREESYASSGFGASPFVSVPAEQLVAEGFVQTAGDSTDYYAPDAQVLLSDAFLDTHCMRLAEGKPGEEGLIGIAFEPIDGRDVPEIQGTFWLDRETAQLRYLEYGYTNLDLGIPLDQVGGRVNFEMLPNGAWIVRRWWIRMPVVGERRMAWRGERRTDRLLLGIFERGGEATAIFAATGERIRTAPTATLAGVVYDSTRAAPLAGATVYLSGTQFSATSAADGRFRLEELPDGTYTVAFSHPRLDSLPLASYATREVVLERGKETTIRLGIPPLAAILAAACPPPDRRPEGVLPGERTGTALGFVHDASTGRTITNATVLLGWSRFDLASNGSGVLESPWLVQATTDARGRYRVCHLPANVPIRARVEFRGRESDPIEFTVPVNAVARQDLVLEAGS